MAALQIITINFNIVAIVLVPIDHLLCAFCARSLVAFAPYRRFCDCKGGGGGGARHTTFVGHVIDVWLSAAVRRESIKDCGEGGGSLPVRNPTPLYNDQKSMSGLSISINRAKILTAQIHPPAGQAGIAAGTSYDVMRFHGVLPGDSLRITAEKDINTYLYRTEKTTKFSAVTCLMSD